MARFISFYSGSKGNVSAIVADNGDTVLLDCGVSFKKIKTGLESAGIPPEAIRGIVITHEHSDHVSGLSVTLKHIHVPVYLNRPTALALPYVTENAVISENGRFSVGSIEVERFSTYHDASASCGYLFYADGKKIGTLTDCGKMDSKLLEKLAGSDLLYIESNYDEIMLKNGPYPRALQNRILSDGGHLSNAVCADTVSRLVMLGLGKVVLGHISENNNTYMQAQGTTCSALRKSGLKATVEVADESPTPLIVTVE